MKARLLPLLAVVVTGLLLVHGFATPRSGSVSPTLSGRVDQAQNGAPLGVTPGSSGTATPLATPTSTSDGLVRTSAAAPHPTSGTIPVAVAWNPELTPEPTPKPRLITGGIVGDATYYCRPGISRCTRGYPFGMYAAAGPEVRAMLGPGWRGQFVIVTDAVGRGVVVQLIDVCWCPPPHLIDLYWTAYQGLVNPVTVKEEP